MINPMIPVQIGVVAFRIDAVLLLISVSLKGINPHANPQLKIPTTTSAFHGNFQLISLRFHHKMGSRTTAPAKQRRNTIPQMPAGGNSHFIKTNDKPHIKLRPIKAPYNRSMISPLATFNVRQSLSCIQHHNIHG
jgi:hypothetical protein